MPSENLEEDFHSVTDELEVPGTSYRFYQFFTSSWIEVFND